MTFTYVTVTRNYDIPDGTDPAGYLTFVPAVPMVNDGVTVAAVPVRANLDVDGLVSIDLAATTDPDTLPTTATYLVTEKIAGQATRQYYVAIPHSSPTVDLGELDTLDAVPPRAAALAQHIADTDPHPGLGLTLEQIRDTIGTTIVAGAGITKTVDDPGDTVTIAASLDAEGVRDTIGTTVVGGTGITVTVDDPGNTVEVAVSEAEQALTRRPNRVVWAIGDSLTAGNLDHDADLYSDRGHPALQYQPSSWETWALLASGGRWTFGGVFATGGYSAAQILATHVPSVIAAAEPGDVVVVFAGTNNNVLADVKTIHATLRAASLHTLAVAIPPSDAAGLTAVTQFNAGLKTYADRQGIPLADVHSAVVDTAAGTYQAALDNDGVHPNEAGYRQFGYTIAAALAQLYPVVQDGLIDHNAAVTGQLQTKPLALGSPSDGPEYTDLSSLGTSTIAAAANPSFAGGQGYKFTVGDTFINARLSNMTFVAGHRMRIGMAIEAVVVGGGEWGMRLESNTTGDKVLWGLGYATTASLSQAPGRFYVEFTVPTLPDYGYRLRIAVDGAGTTLHLGEVTMMDLTAMGAA